MPNLATSESLRISALEMWMKCSGDSAGKAGRARRRTSSHRWARDQSAPPFVGVTISHAVDPVLSAAVALHGASFSSTARRTR